MGFHGVLTQASPLKGSVSEPEGEAWVEVVPYLSYPEGVAYNQLLGMS